MFSFAAMRQCDVMESSIPVLACVVAAQEKRSRESRNGFPCPCMCYEVLEKGEFGVSF